MVAVKPALSGVGGAPVITSGTTASGTVGSAFSYQITATNTPTSYGATGLAAGLAVNTSTGLISGTPTAAGKIGRDHGWTPVTPTSPMPPSASNTARAPVITSGST